MNSRVRAFALRRTTIATATRTCTEPGCANKHQARGYCSTHYNQKLQPNRHATKPVPCTACGTTIERAIKADRRPACSVACRTVLTFGHHMADPGYDWASMAAVRARRAGATVIESFDRSEIFERDGWTCYLCHGLVDREASAFHRDSATVDHVVPLSQGGEHSKRNAATAHLRCNSAKQDRPAMIDSA